jgi:hypothetical protein
VTTKPERVGQGHINVVLLLLFAHKDVQVNIIFRVLQIQVGVQIACSRMSSFST